MSSDAARVAAQEVMNGDGAAQQSAAEARDSVSAEQQAAGTVVGSEPSRAASDGAASAAVLPQHARRQAGNVDASPAAPGMQGRKHSADEQEDVYQKRRQGDGTIYDTNLFGL